MNFKQNSLERQQSHITVVKAKTLPHGQFEAVLSTEDLDRHGERVSIKGLEIPKNQVIKMYYNHETNGANLPIGKWLKVWKKDGVLMGLGEIDLEDDFAVKVYKKVLKGIIDSISVGFYPTEYDGDTSTWTKSTLVEASVVAEPANVNAVITSKELGFSQEEFKQSLKVKLKEAEPEQEVPAEEPDQEEAEEPVAEVEPVESPSSESGASDLAELKSAIEDLNSRQGAVEAALQAAIENPAKKNVEKVRFVLKQVDQSVEKANRVIKVQLKETQ